MSCPAAVKTSILYAYMERAQILEWLKISKRNITLRQSSVSRQRLHSQQPGLAGERAAGPVHAHDCRKLKRLGSIKPQASGRR